MKNISFVILFAIVLASCDSMLDITPKTDLTDTNFWLSEAHFKGASNMLYSQLPDKGWDGRSDEQIDRGFSGQNISSGRWTLPTTSGDWTDPYRRIANANNIIENAPNSPVAERVRNRYLGEALFFRAWWHFNLVCKYGDVPMVLKTFKETQDPDLKKGRTPREEVIQQCYADLEEAAKYLPTRYDLRNTTDEVDRCRATRSAALALMVRIGLHEGTMSKYHNLNNNWQAHLDVSIKAFENLKSEGHALYTGDNNVGGYNLSYLGMVLEEGNNVNLEIIFRKPHGPNANPTSGYWNTGYSSQCQENWAVTRWIIDMYLYADGLPGEKSAYYLPARNETAYNSVFGFEADGITSNGHPRDPRLPLSFWREGDPQDNTSVNVAGLQIAWRIRRGETFNHYYNTSRQIDGYHPKKGHVGAMALSGGTTSDHILMRWGEMLISYAEALYERNGSITDAQLDETVNALRARVGFSAKLTNAFASANSLDMREEIRRERTVELLLENRRYNDIIRWKIAETVLPKAVVGFHYFPNTAREPAQATAVAAACTDANGNLNGVFVYPAENMWVWEQAAGRSFRPERDYYYPIPTNEIAKSDNNIEQNPNW